jgi:hypothetical protein
MYKDIFLTTLDIPYSLPFLVWLCITLGKGTKLQTGDVKVLFVGVVWIRTGVVKVLCGSELEL